MGMGPVAATRKLLARLGLALERHRSDRAQRGVRRAGARRAARARPRRRCRAREPLGRRHRARSSARRERRAARRRRRCASSSAAAAAARCAPCASASDRASPWSSSGFDRAPRERGRHPQRAPRRGRRDRDRPCAGECARATGARGAARGRRVGGVGPCRTRHRHSRRGAAFRRGCRYPRIRPRAARAAPQRCAAAHRGRDQAGDRGIARLGARRRVRARARVPLSRGRAGCLARPAGNSPRPTARLGRHATPAAAHRRAPALELHAERRSHRHRAGASPRHRRSARAARDDLARARVPVRAARSRAATSARGAFAIERCRAAHRIPRGSPASAPRPRASFRASPP